MRHRGQTLAASNVTTRGPQPCHLHGDRKNSTEDARPATTANKKEKITEDGDTKRHSERNTDRGSSRAHNTTPPSKMKIVTKNKVKHATIKEHQTRRQSEKGREKWPGKKQAAQGTAQHSTPRHAKTSQNTKQKQTQKQTQNAKQKGLETSTPQFVLAKRRPRHERNPTAGSQKKQNKKQQKNRKKKKEKKERKRRRKKGESAEQTGEVTKCGSPKTKKKNVVLQETAGGKTINKVKKNKKK
ncbi:hypothetical protein TvY486_0036870 [Trypanosoma vivax Y486]|uniref:Uncharacterized protein n=1 Tax=Trypanosoma vivax (strain Y486) TaxID=1055687 RepID=F9WTB8_TRYVY|nr:hypothetical protein TvY486_0036870 [Trypanosoma vivax Y486]|eukprot:CCD20811.1 hypothetical protein TvY486_0036870 [Trypanosoma vivax Y486]